MTRVRGSILLLAIFVTFPWLITSLICNLNGVHVEGASATVSAISTKTTQAVATFVYAESSESGSGEQNALVCVAGGLGILAVILYKRFKPRRKNDYYHLETSTYSDRQAQVALLGLLASIVILVMNIPRILPLLQVQESYSASRTDWTATSTILGFTFVIGASILGLFILLNRKNSSVPNQSAHLSLRPEMKEFKEIIDDTKYLLEAGSDFRSTILTCYKQLCLLVGEHGVPKQDSLTPREFESIARTRLNIENDFLPQLTALFEKARYSSETVSSYEAANAQECLNGLSLQLRELEKHGTTNRTQTNIGASLHG